MSYTRSNLPFRAFSARIGCFALAMQSLQACGAGARVQDQHRDVAYSPGAVGGETRVASTSETSTTMVIDRSPADDSPSYEREEERDSRSRGRDFEAAPSPTMVERAEPAPPVTTEAYRSDSSGTMAFVPPHAVPPVAQQVAPPPTVYLPPSGILTAGSVGDVDRFPQFNDYLGRQGQLVQVHALNSMSRRVRYRVVSQDGRAVPNAQIVVRNQSCAASGRTHLDGRWDHFPYWQWRAQTSCDVWQPQEVTVVYGGQSQRFELRELYRNGQEASYDVVLRADSAQLTRVRSLTLGFLIDVTGSMGDELRYLQGELAGIVHRIEDQAQVQVNLGAVLYRDRSDREPIRQIQFTRDTNGFIANLASAHADGGGDYPEDLNRGFETILGDQAWSGSDDARVLVVLGDAPPQNYGGFTYRDAMNLASERGIRILPVAASGADREVEVLFRSMGAFTSTPYVYLTNDSGVGGQHMDADTDRVAVERFADLLVRMVLSDLRSQGMHEPGRFGVDQG